MIVGVLTKAPLAPTDLPREGRLIYKRVAAYMVDRQQLHSADLELIHSYVVAVMRVRAMEVDPETDDRMLLSWRREKNALANMLMLSPGARAKADKQVRKATVHGDSAAPRTVWGDKLRSVK